MSMRWTGKVVGGFLGLLALGPFGALLGAVAGHQFDQAAGAGKEADREAGPFGARFFTATFEVMGHLAKADGRVSEREIAAARGVMSDLRLQPAAVQAAITCFHRGKASTFDLAAAVTSLRRACGDRPDLLRIFFEIQMRASLDGTDLAQPTRAHVQRLGTLLGISAFEFAYIETALRVRRGHGAGGGSAGGARPQPPSVSLEEAYAVLEIEASAGDAEVVKAYRRQLSRHHPDKLKANGLPESMLEHAKQRTQQIIEAYELVRDRRGIR